MIGLQFVELTATFIEVFLGIWINANMLSEISISKKRTAFAAILVALAAWILNQYQLFSVFISVLGIAGIVMGAYVIYKVNLLDSFVLTIFYMILIYIIDFFSISVFGMVFQEEQFAKIVASAFSVERVCFIALSKTLLVSISYVFVKKWLSRIGLPVRKIWIGVVLSFFFLYHLVKSTLWAVDTEILWSWGLFLVVVLLSIYSAVQYIDYLHEKNQLNMAIERYTMQLETYDKLIQTYQENQIFYHDLKNQYLVIENYLKNQEYDKAEAYMKELKMTKFEDLYKQRTGNRAVDILLDYKLKEAELHQIHVDAVVDVIDLKLTDQELTALLGNALDNAIEACRKMENETKWIRITIQKIQEMTLIKVSNSYGKQPLERSGLFVSLKNNPQIHGLGIKSMRMIVEKYDGKMKTNYSNGEFSVVISFFD